MNFAKSLLASAALVASFGASAIVTGSLGSGPTGPLLTLSTETFNAPCSTAPEPSNDCTLGPLNAPIATISGGTVYNADLVVADDVLPNTAFLASGPSSGTPVMTFLSGTAYLGLLWGSPDTYNILTIRDTNDVDYVFTTTSLGFTVQNGDQSFNQYVQFVASAGTLIASVTFTSATDAFETTPVHGHADPGAGDLRADARRPRRAGLRQQAAQAVVGLVDRLARDANGPGDPGAVSLRGACSRGATGPSDGRPQVRPGAVEKGPCTLRSSARVGPPQGASPWSSSWLSSASSRS